VTFLNGSNDVERDETKTREKESKRDERQEIETDWLQKGRRVRVKMAFSFPCGDG